MTTDFEIAARSIVRSYSFEAEERLSQNTQTHTLGMALAVERRNGRLNDITTPWRAFFEPDTTRTELSDPITDVIRTESAKLREKWLVFYQDNPHDERLDLKSSKPTTQDVVTMVTAVTAQWQAKRKQGFGGRAKSLFHRFCGTLNSHSSLIKLLPEGNEYVSVFTGALNAIIKASANHEKIAEGFAEGLYTISEHIEEVDKYLTLFPRDEAIRTVVDLYGHVFLFLSSVMDWIMKKRARRLLDSFKENFNERFRDELTKVDDRVTRIRNLAAQSAMGEARVTRLNVEDLTRDVRLGTEGTLRHQAEVKLWAERIESRLAKAEEDRRLQDERMRHLGGSVVAFLEADARKWLDTVKNMSIAAPTIGSAFPFQNLAGMIPSGRSIEKKERHCIAEDIAWNSRHLEDFFPRERFRLATETFSPSTMNPEVVLRLSEWAQSQHDPILWLDGPAVQVDDIDNPLTNLAAKFIDLAEMHRMPVISYFCEIPRIIPDNATRESRGAISLLYALVRQMVELLLPQFDTTADLSEERFLKLDGTLDSWLEALRVLRDLMDLKPGVVYCVIEGLQWLDDKTTDLPLAELVECLRGGKLKVLFTTSGRSGCLLECLENAESLIVGDRESGDLIDGLDDQSVHF